MRNPLVGRGPAKATATVSQGVRITPASPLSLTGDHGIGASDTALNTVRDFPLTKEVRR